MNESASNQIVFEFARASLIDGWWWWALLIASLALLIGGCVRFYRRDTDELSAPVRTTLIFLRLVTVVALIFFFFDLQRRTQREIVRPSEVVVLVDTSQSMSLAESDEPGSESRIARVTDLLEEKKLSEKLGDQHRVSVYAFGETPEPILLEARGLDQPATMSAGEPEEEGAIAEGSASRSILTPVMIGLLLVGVSLLAGMASLIVGAFGKVSGFGKSGGTVNSGGSRSDSISAASPLGWLLLVSAVTLFGGIIVSGGAYSVRTGQTFRSLIGLAEGDKSADSEDGSDTDEADRELPESIKVLDWSEAIAASASQSRISDAIASVLASHDPTTLAGIVLLTDGQNNGGTNVASAMSLAKRSEIAVYPIGLGSSEPPTNIRVVDLDAPKRVYPEDKFAVSAVLQATGGKQIKVDVQLLDALDQSGGDDESNLPTDVVDTQNVTLDGDGGLIGVKFELEPESVGRRRLAIRVVAPPNDQNDQDNVRDARYEVVTRKLRVMVIAGGPTREYRFVRNLLFREKSIRLDAWLQSGQPGMSQDADALLTEFPSTAAELFEYDAITMFDPDWTRFSAEQLELLDRWVSSQAGGMIIVGGPVYHPQWLRLRTDPRVAQIAGFYPVTFSSRGLISSGGREGGEASWPIEFTAESRRAEFLWVTDQPASSFEAWDSFGGVYDYVGVRAAKPVAKVYGYFSDPSTRISESLPVYLASQFYGAGRVFFQGSGEMWRMRRESVSYFDSYYTKLVRWVSEGRLLRDSNRGLLLVDNPRAMVGDTIAVRAVLTDAQFEPLTVSEVKATLLVPQGAPQEIRLTPVEGEARPGTYSGRFVVRQPGDHELQLTLGDALEEVVLRQNVAVRLPTVELERPQRNDQSLGELADATGGEYWRLETPADHQSIVGTIVETIRPQPQLTVLPGTPDSIFTLRRNAVLLWLIASMLTMEWVIRRLHRLA
ncbi:VWA domain-containing protein [Roseiconus lacunae]|uniref:VWA domain-containing protein n=1 Tax=Roseiconus lacunae TaxID=2605694 RepID=UPI001E5F61FB|nr:VWA domain-containing protein [Roseiconus lacunae]MCD0459805.1 VWA domain-containing protein [Roseiconus lacunae]